MDLEINSYCDKNLKKDSNRLGFGILLYSIFMMAVVIIGAVFRTIGVFIKNPNASDAVLDQISDAMMVSGVESLIGVIIGTFLLKLFFNRSELKHNIFYSNDDIKFIHFLEILFVFMSVQYIFSVLSFAGEAMLNSFGFSMMGELESATSSSTTISMFLYASIIGPISEELIFRGFVLRNLEKYGKNLAIIVSAVMFGAFHGNFIQGIFAFVVGIVLGYVTLRYSIKWAMVLHVINNLVFGDLMGYFTKNMSESMQTTIWGSIYTVFLMGSIWVLFMKRKEIKNYIVENKSRGYIKVFSSLGMILFLIAMVFMAALGIESI